MFRPERVFSRGLSGIHSGVIPFPAGKMELVTERTVKVFRGRRRKFRTLFHGNFREGIPDRGKRSERVGRRGVVIFFIILHGFVSDPMEPLVKVLGAPCFFGCLMPCRRRFKAICHKTRSASVLFDIPAAHGAVGESAWTEYGAVRFRRNGVIHQGIDFIQNVIRILIVREMSVKREKGSSEPLIGRVGAISLLKISGADETILRGAVQILDKILCQHLKQWISGGFCIRIQLHRPVDGLIFTADAVRKKAAQRICQSFAPEFSHFRFQIRRKQQKRNALWNHIHPVRARIVRAGTV